jgi:hypothetical protein
MLLSTGYCPLSAVCCPLSAVCCLLSAVCCLLYAQTKCVSLCVVYACVSCRYLGNRKSVLGKGDDYEPDEEFASMLVDALQYDHMELTFRSFKALVVLVAQDFAFMKAVDHVTVLTKEPMAKLFYEMSAKITEFRRLRKWTHDDSSCVDLMKVADDLMHSCRSGEDTGDGEPSAVGQNLMRNLKLHDYIRQFLILRESGKARKIWMRMLCKVLNLVEVFCDCNVTNQEVMSNDIDDVLIPLMELEIETDAGKGQRPFITDVAKCLTSIVAQNETLCVRYSAVLTDKVSMLAKVSPDHGRSTSLLKMLEMMLIADGHTITQAQIAVCKGASVSDKLMELNGDLMKNEISPGPQMAREEVMIEGLVAKGKGKERCLQHLAYYGQCLRLLGICARGKMPTTELLCASVVPFVEVVSRMHECFNEKLCPQGLCKKDDEVRNTRRFVAGFSHRNDRSIACQDRLGTNTQGKLTRKNATRIA